MNIRNASIQLLAATFRAIENVIGYFEKSRCGSLHLYLMKSPWTDIFLLSFQGWRIPRERGRLSSLPEGQPC